MEIEIDESLEKLIKSQSDCSEIVKISYDQVTYNQFFTEFMLKNVPVILKNVNLLTQLSKTWFFEEKFNINLLKNDISDIEVPVYNCSKQYFNSHEKTSMKFKDYVEYWQSDRKNDLLYLKDFHLKQQTNPALDFYNVPQFFASDWLNEYLIDTGKDDYRFVYIGVKGTWTPLHADVFGSYSWSGNVSGIKRWLILCPKEENKLKDKFGQLPFSVDEKMLQENDVKYFDIIQEANEVLFVPSQWFHQVSNLTDVFSINHNWFNSCNIEIIKENLLQNFQDVKAEIDDCSDMENFEDHCQLMLKSLFGMDFKDFVEILMHIGMKRIKSSGSFRLFEKYYIGKNLMNFEQKIIRQVLEEMLNIADTSDELKLKIQNYIDSSS